MVSMDVRYGERAEGRADRRATRLPRACFVLSLLCWLALLGAAVPAQAQDTTRAPVDTLRSDTLRRDTLRAPAAPRDTTLRDTTLRDTTLRDSLAADTTRRRRRRTLSKAEALGFDRPRRGRPVTGRLPVRDPALDATALLARAPGAFRYDFGAVGWPHGVSFYGRPPGQTTLTLDGLPFDDLLTGRPRYDLLPMPFMAPLRVQASGGRGAPGAVSAALRPYRFGRPLTELRYRSGGLQSIGALHTQQRKVRFFGVPAIAQFTGGYFGRGADNLDFLSSSGLLSDLRSERRVLGRVRYRRRTWALQLTALHNRRGLGLNGGVVLRPGEPADSAFALRPVLFPQAENRLRRTDLAATLRLRTPLAESPFTATAYRTTQSKRYRNPALTDSLPAADTLDAETARYGLRLTQSFALRTKRLGRHALSVEAHAYADRFSEGNALPEDAARTSLHLVARDSTRLGDINAALSAGLHVGPRQTYPSAAALLAHAPAGDTLRFFAEARLSGQPVSWIADEGFGPLVRPLPEGRTPGPVVSAEVGARARAGLVEGRLAVFANHTADRLDLYATGAPAVAQAAVAGGGLSRVGATLSARWRFREERGFYAAASTTAFLGENDAPRLNRAAPTVPLIHGQGRIGARYAFFTDDLALDAYVRARFWSQMKSRALHTPTGRLVVPRSDSPSLDPSGVLDLHAEATVRTATLFFSYENALSGTAVQAGTINVPIYPLPQQQIRFGVYWPIFN
jgi:hypothetical protein